MTAPRPVTVGLDEVEGLIERAHSAIARAKALRESAEFARKKAEAVHKSAAGSCVRSGGWAASLVHSLERASHDLQVLQSRIDAVMKQNVVAFARPLRRRR